MKQPKKRCWNCKWKGEEFVVYNKLHYCQHQTYTAEKFESGEVSPYDTLHKVFDTCDKHLFNPDKIK